MDCRKRRDRLALGQGVGIVFQQPDEQITPLRCWGMWPSAIESWDFPRKKPGSGPGMPFFSWGWKGLRKERPNISAAAKKSG